MPGFERLEITRRSGREPFHAAGTRLGVDLLSFWQWSMSDVVCNSTRGLVAEFLVAHALEVAGGVRVEWDACDLRTASGLKIEVKSAAYLQTWAQSNKSKIKFNICPKRGWDAATNSYATERCRAADIYVFALHAHQRKDTIDPLDVNQWQFYVLPTAILNEHRANQKTITLGSLRKLVPMPVSFGELGEAIQGAARMAGAAPD